MYVRSLSLAALGLSLAAPALFAQNAPNLGTAAYTAVSSTAMGVTGDIRTAPATLIFKERRFPLKMQQAYSGADLQNVAKMFSSNATPDSKAALYRIRIPAGLKLANGNTYCGNSETTFVVLLQKGSDLEIAAFSGNAVPDLTPAVLNNSTNLCGTYGYTRK